MIIMFMYITFFESAQARVYMENTTQYFGDNFGRGRLIVTKMIISDERRARAHAQWMNEFIGFYLCCHSRNALTPPLDAATAQVENLKEFRW